MDRLWAPWRMNYLKQELKHVRRAGGCVFCRMIKEKDDKKNLVIVRGEHCFIVLNLYPYNNGHLLVVPNRHVGDLKHLKFVEKKEFFEMVEYGRDLLSDVLEPEGFNIGMNLGRAAGAGIPRHMHMHVVPRWLGDVNFMPITAETKVISESLQQLRKQLSDAHKTRIRRI